MSSPVEQIKARLGIAEVVGSYIQLERAGVNFRARCPFHNEKTPSFHVSPSRESYHCFGCDKGGDIFSFVEEIEGVDFREALKILAEKAGVELVRENAGERGERSRLLSAMEEAALFFSGQLARTPAAREYLRSRGISEQTIEKFRIGFAPAAWQTLYLHLRGKRFTDEEIERAGLAVRSSRPSPGGQRLFDRFRSRVMFPISDSSGRIVAFSGRIFGEAPPDAAKYVNSPQTALYDKSKILFGYDAAKRAVREADAVVCVEGQMDLVLSHQAGVNNTVAVSGTALTDDHLALLGRLTKKIIFAFDADPAGVSAAGRGIERALAMGFEVTIAGLPLGLDPADMVRTNPADWVEAVKAARHVILFYLAHIASQGHDPLTLRREVQKTVLPYIARIGSAVEQAHFIGETARVIGIDEQPIREDVVRLRGAAEVRNGPDPRRLEVRPPENSRSEKIERRLMALLLWQKSVSEPRVDIEYLSREIARVVGDAFEQGLARIGAGGGSELFEAESLYGELDQKGLTRVALELLRGLEEELLRSRRTDLLRRLKEAEMRGDGAGVDEIMRLCQDIDLALKKLSGDREGE